MRSRAGGGGARGRPGSRGPASPANRSLWSIFAYSTPHFFSQKWHLRNNPRQKWVAYARRWYLFYCQRCGAKHNAKNAWSRKSVFKVLESSSRAGA